MGARLEPRVSRWSESSFDIRALRQMALDGPLAVDADSQALLATSLAQAMVKSDDAGNTRLVKKGHNNTSRDDVATALTLAAGALARKPRSATVRSLGLAGWSWRRGGEAKPSPVVEGETTGTRPESLDLCEVWQVWTA